MLQANKVPVTAQQTVLPQARSGSGNNWQVSEDSEIDNRGENEQKRHEIIAIPRSP